MHIYNTYTRHYSVCLNARKTHITVNACENTYNEKGEKNITLAVKNHVTSDRIIEIIMLRRKHRTISTGTRIITTKTKTRETLTRDRRISKKIKNKNQQTICMLCEFPINRSLV